MTFDNGPTPGVTDRVLDILHERGVTATFFAVGNQAAVPEGRELLERALAEGHRIGNHSMTHRVPLGELDPQTSVDEITDAAEVLDGLLGVERQFRPFGRGGRIGPHLLSPAAVDRLCTDGYTLALWSSVPRDWVDPDGWVDVALAQIRDDPWPVVVLHDFEGGCLARLPDFLDELERLGAELTTALPDRCTPIRRGRVIGDLGSIVTPSTAPTTSGRV